MRLVTALLALLFLHLCAPSIVAYTLRADDNLVLVILDDAGVAKTHSKLLDSLRAKGFDLDVRTASNDLSLMRDGAYVYAGVALLCPTASGVASVLPESTLAAFLDAGRDVFLAAAPSYSTYTKSVAKLMGVDLEDSPALMIDHVNFASDHDSGDHTYITAGGRVASPFLFGAAASAPHDNVAFKGPGATLFKDNELVDAVMWGAGSAYTGIPGKPLRTALRAVGSQAVLAATLSTRTRSRAVYFGSLDALSDTAFEAAGGTHAEALTTLFAWTYGHSGVIELRNVRHFQKDGDGEMGDSYRVKDVLIFEGDIVTWDGGSRKWVPYEADDVQLEFIMLNPWVRTRLVRVPGAVAGTYRAEVQVPDQIGVYKFAVEYYRPGVNHISFAMVVPIRPYLHNEYKRFITQAYPYYASSFSMLVGVLLLGIVLLYGNMSGSETGVAGAGSQDVGKQLKSKKN